jgi:hypothetical protein
MPPSRSAELVGRWVHVFEENDERGEVYRRGESDIPLSRRPRAQLEFRADGTARVMSAGPDDRMRERPAAWREDGDEVRVDLTGEDARADALRVVERRPDRIVVRR